MLADFYIPRLAKYVKIAVQKNYVVKLGTEVLSRHVEKTASFELFFSFAFVINSSIL